MIFQRKFIGSEGMKRSGKIRDGNQSIELCVKFRALQWEWTAIEAKGM